MKKICFNALIFMPIFFGVLELSARIDDKINYNADFFKKYGYENLIEDDNEGIRHNIPNARFEKWKINSLGFRGKEAQLGKKKDHIRIVCFGASETFGLYESAEKEWPQQLDVLLNKGYANIEIINASVVGLKRRCIKKYFEKYILPLEPDIVVIVQGIFGYAVGYKEEGKNEKKGDESKLSIIKSNIRFLSKIKEAVKKCVPDILLNKVRLYRLGKQVYEKESRYLLSGKVLITDVPQENVLEFEKDLKDFIIYLRNQNIIPVLSTYPTLIRPSNKDIYRSILLDYRRFYIELSEDGIIGAPRVFNDAIERIANENNVFFVDIDKEIPKNTKYFADNVHYTDLGAKLIAEKMSLFLINNIYEQRKTD